MAGETDACIGVVVTVKNNTISYCFVSVVHAVKFFFHRIAITIQIFQKMHFSNEECSL